MSDFPLLTFDWHAAKAKRIKIKENASINASYYGKQGSLVPKTTIQQDMVT